MNSSAWIELATSCLTHAEANVQNAGLYDGFAGLASTCVEVGMLLGDKRWVRRGIDMLQTFRNIAPLEQWDLISGTAGVIVALVGAGVAADEWMLIEEAERRADAWLRLATRGEHWLSWDALPPQDGGAPHGLAHGASGCAVALELLGCCTGNRRWSDAAELARCYDDRAMAELTQDSEKLEPSWCWGLSGIAAERVSGARHESGGIVRALERWVRKIPMEPRERDKPCTWNLSVCHGIAGAVDVLISAVEEHDTCLLEAAGRLTELARESLKHGEVPCGIFNAGEQPGFMVGLAGVAHVLARIDAPERFPAATLPPLAGLVLARGEGEIKRMGIPR